MGCTCTVEIKEFFKPNINEKNQEEEIKIKVTETINDVKKEEESEVINEAKKEEESEAINKVKEKEEPEEINDAKKKDQKDVINNSKKEEEPEVINDIKKKEKSEVINDIKKKRKQEVINDPKKEEEPEVINDIKKNEEPKAINDAKKKEDKPLNKKNCQTLVSSLPMRTKTNLPALKNTMRSKTKDLSEKEKSYVVFKWECDNIDYDVQSYFEGRDVDCTPEGVFKKGKTVCSGYSRLYKDITSHLGLNVLCVNCYAKGFGYQPGEKFTETDHEYNVVNIDGKWYAIDCTWGAGYVEGNSYVKKFDEFYFLANPEFLIKTHFPEDEKWQLTKKRYTKADFERWPEVKDNFYKYGFTKFFPEEAVLNLKDANNQKFIVWGNNIKQKDALCNVSFLKGNNYVNQPSLSFVIPCEDRFEINCRFNKKGTYLIQIYGSKNGGKSNYEEIIEYKVNVENDAKKELKFPHTYDGAHVIKLIEPLYNGLKSGKIVKFKMESDLDTIIIMDTTWHYLKRNKEGFFEKEIKIRARKNLLIGKGNGSKSALGLIEYDVVS